MTLNSKDNVREFQLYYIRNIDTSSQIKLCSSGHKDGKSEKRYFPLNYSFMAIFDSTIVPIQYFISQ